VVREKQIVSVRGYSDAINHAFAFAAKHHDRQVRKGTKLPYFTQPANVAVILSRYACSESTVVAGILHDVVQDSIREGSTLESLQRRVGEKFGAEALSFLLAVTQRRLDDDGVELASDEMKTDYLERLASAPRPALWVSAAEKVHNANSLLSDLRRTMEPDSVWSRTSGGRDATVKWYRDVLNRFTQVGFTEPITEELREVVTALEKY
jgi:(p)ppGpp synthase/HD superfamily hydrolase